MDQAIKKKYNYWQWRTLIILMIGYALFYFVRKNFSIAMPALKSELGLDETHLGIFLTLNGIIYGVSRFINGFISDRAKSKKFIMGMGLLLSAIVNILIGLSPQMNGFFHLLDNSGKATIGMVYFIGSLWLINGFTQGMGYPPCGSLMAHWIKPSELATKQSIWNSSHSIGAGLVAVLVGTLILGRFGYEAWQWCFFIPAILAAVGSCSSFSVSRTPRLLWVCLILKNWMSMHRRRKSPSKSLLSMPSVFMMLCSRRWFSATPSSGSWLSLTSVSM